MRWFTVTFRPPLPYRIKSKSSGANSRTGALAENPLASATASIRLIYHAPEVPTLTQGVTAPCVSDKSLFGITKSGSTASLYPNPLHSPQAPCGLLKLKVRGSISGKLTLHLAQANRSENTSVSPPPAAAAPLSPSCAPESSSASTTPSPSRRQVSTDSATRASSVSGRTISRSTTSSI